MNRPCFVSFLAFAFACAAPLSAAEVVADFNDLALGDPRASNPSQTANSGTGFSDAYWSVNTGILKAVAGDLVAPVATNHAVTQSGDGKSFQAPNYSVADASDRRQARAIATPLTGVVWFSFLVYNDAADRSAGIDFNTSASNFGTAIGGRIVVEGGTLRVINAANVESVSLPGAVPLGETALIVGRIAIGASPAGPGNDVINLWVNPVLTVKSSGLGAATWGSNNTNFLGSATRISVLGLQSYSTLTGPGQYGGVLDSVRLADGDTAYSDITGLVTIPEASSLAALLGGLGLAGAALARRGRSASTEM